MQPVKSTSIINIINIGAYERSGLFPYERSGLFSYEGYGLFSSFLRTYQTSHPSQANKAMWESKSERKSEVVQNFCHYMDDIDLHLGHPLKLNNHCSNFDVNQKNKGFFFLFIINMMLEDKLDRNM